MRLRTLIADDEPPLRQALVRELIAQMPDIEVVSEVGNGIDALNWLRKNPVDLCFLDIRMPGLTGLEVASVLLEEKPSTSESNNAAPLVVFVTAYDEYAVQAFEADAVDYLLKPVTTARLKQTLVRVLERVEHRENREHQEELKVKLRHTLSKLSELSDVDKSIRSIRASVGDQIRLIPIGEIALFQAEDKYVSVHTAGQHALIRESLKYLLPRLPSGMFVQIHRGSIVNLDYIEAANRTATGKLTLKLRGLDVQPVVSRPFRYLFKAM